MTNLQSTNLHEKNSSYTLVATINLIRPFLQLYSHRLGTAPSSVLMIALVENVQDVERSRRQEDADRVAEEVHPCGYHYRLAPLEHLNQQNHHNDMPNFRLELVEGRDLHPLWPFLYESGNRKK